jgi:hypothetical protein
MRSERFHVLARSLTAPGTRRGALAASLTGAFSLLAPGGTEAGRRKKKRNKKKGCNEPFCHGKDCSVDTRCERPGSAVPCFCRHDPKTGGPKCVQGSAMGPIDNCSACPGDELCVSCTGQLTCNLPCPNPR